MTTVAEQIAAIKASMNLGVREVQYANGRRVQYRSFAEMLQALRFLEGQGDTSPQQTYERAPTAGYAYFNRGE